MTAIPVAVLPRDTLRFIQEIGEGCFGKVYKGRNKNSAFLNPVIISTECYNVTRVILSNQKY